VQPGRGVRKKMRKKLNAGWLAVVFNDEKGSALIA
jgi:hypothetical protein